MEETPSGSQPFEIETGIPGVLKQLERHMIEADVPAEQLWEHLVAARTDYYGAMQDALAKGVDFAEAKKGVEPQETAYRNLQAEAAQRWLDEHQKLMGDGIDHLVALCGSHPDWMTPGVTTSGLKPHEIEQIFRSLPDGIVVPESHGQRYQHIGTRAFFNFTMAPAHHAGPDTPIGSMVTQTQEMLVKVADGAWYGPSDVIDRTSAQLAQQGCEVRWNDGLPNFDDVVIQDVIQPGFVPHTEINAGRQTLGEPRLPVVVM